MKCPNCENQIPDKAKVCGYCGYQFKHADVTQPRKASAARGVPGWVWGLGGALVVAVIGAVLFASSMIASPPSEDAPNAPTAFSQPTEINFPTATLPPSTEVAPEVKVLLEDDFSDSSSGWSTGSTNDFDGNYADGGWYQLSLGHTSATWVYMQYRAGEPQGKFDGFSLEVVCVCATCVGFGGLVFRRSAPYNFYAFEVATDGKFRLVRADQSDIFNWITLVDWTSSRVLLPVGINRLKVVASGDLISLYANGQFLTSVQDNTYLSGWIGLHIGNYGGVGDNADYIFDNVRITNP